MDVRCPKCQSEYDFDESRVPDTGVTVKCAACSFVFLVRKASQTLPEKAQLPPSATREWKVRQPNGNIYTCRELTTLQRWIVEGKVARGDEISLTGETWKRLGNIPELASFFSVAEDAQRARAQQFAASVEPLPAVVVHPSLSPPVAAQRLTETWREKSFALPPPEAAVPDETWREPAPGVPSYLTKTWREPNFATPAPLPRVPVAAEPDTLATLPESFGVPPAQKESTFETSLKPPTPSAPTQVSLPTPVPELSEEELERLSTPKSSNRWLALVLAGLGVGGAVGYYAVVYLPEQRQLAKQQEAEAQAVLDAKVRAETEAQAKALVEAEARERLEDAGAPDAGVMATVDAGRPDAGVPDGGSVPPRPLTFDQMIAQADRLRDRERPQQALALYGQASDLLPDRVEPWAGKGLTYLDLSEPAKAEAAFERALSLSPRYGPAIMGMAEALRTGGKKSQAIEWYQRYLDVLPEGSEAAVARNNLERLK
jgi:predicted Zn finger-like uncharacterized protein